MLKNRKKEVFMFKLGIIGTASISHEFIKAAHSTGDYQLAAVYSLCKTMKIQLFLRKC